MGAPRLSYSCGEMLALALFWVGKAKLDPRIASVVCRHRHCRRRSSDGVHDAWWVTRVSCRDAETGFRTQINKAAQLLVILNCRCNKFKYISETQCVTVSSTFSTFSSGLKFAEPELQ